MDSIHWAAYIGDLAQVEKLVAKYGRQIVHTITDDGSGCTALHGAAVTGHLDVVKYLIEECGADVEAIDPLGSTPLHEATYNDHLEVVKYLVEQCGANLRVRDKKGTRPMDIARTVDVKEYLQQVHHTLQTVSPSSWWLWWWWW